MRQKALCSISSQAEPSHRTEQSKPPPLPPPSSSSFRLRLCFGCGGLNSAHASLNTGLVLHILLSLRWLFSFFVVFAIGLLRRFLYPILDPLAFVPNTFYTHNLSKYGLFQSLSQHGLFQNPGLHTCFGLNLNRGLNKTNAFASKPSFTQRAVLHKNCVVLKHHVSRKIHVLAGTVQELFAAYRIALSMVAGGARRRRLNMMKMWWISGEQMVKIWYGESMIIIWSKFGSKMAKIWWRYDEDMMNFWWNMVKIWWGMMKIWWLDGDMMNIRWR